MPVKTYKPTTPSRRFITTTDFSSLTKKKPVKSLTSPLPKKAGRSRASGRITVRHQGGGAKRRYRLVDFKQDKFDAPAVVKAIEYDPNRTAFIALLEFEDKEKRYILAPDKLKANDKVVFSQKKIEAKIGNRMPLQYIPAGSIVHNIELNPSQGGRIVRAAGTSAQLMELGGKYANLKLSSGEVRKIGKKCLASIGQISNREYENIVIGKAGRQRHRGIRPTVRGKAMNPVDHPHGGGEGRSPIGMVHPKTRWGKPALGRKTRRRNKKSNKFIIKKRK
ncbi:50S ribosomal protein L2 [Patescibacteria group bacterium]|nr:50S ribosomal protein L2 [Patescibacteria group bacterium]